MELHDIIIFIIAIFIEIWVNIDVDENYLDSYDRYFGFNKQGLSRGKYTGIIYDKNGNVDLMKNLLDTNPYWN